MGQLLSPFRRFELVLSDSSVQRIPSSGLSGMIKFFRAGLSLGDEAHHQPDMSLR